jgi:hypothetical protein
MSADDRTFGPRPWTPLYVHVYAPMERPLSMEIHVEISIYVPKIKRSVHAQNHLTKSIYKRLCGAKSLY